VASIFKRRKAKNEPYTIQYVNHLGKRMTVRGFTDKALTEQLASKLESDARLRSSGLISSEQDAFAAHESADISKHVLAFETSLSNNTETYSKLVMFRVRRILDGCAFTTLGKINSDGVQNFLELVRKSEDLGNKTYNHYLQAIDTFLNWCVKSKRIVSNPIVGLDRLNNAVDVRHQRRALTTEEVELLVTKARTSGKYIQCQSPEQRARVYTVAYMTGLRKRELSSLCVSSFKLDENPPTVTVEASSSKHRKKDVLPLHPDLVQKLRSWTKGLKQTQHLFPGLERKKLSLMIRKDLEAAGIAYETVDGIADFHAAGRHTYITQLLRSGVSVPEAKELARHSDVNMTMRYTHIGIDDQAEALARLPRLGAVAGQSALHGRCISGGFGGHSVSAGGTTAEGKSGGSPTKTKGIGIKRQSLSQTDKAEGTGIEPATPYGALHFQ